MPTVFQALAPVVALIWAISIVVIARNAIVAVKSRGKNDNDRDKRTTAPAPTPDAPPTIAGMPLGTYYATLNDWTNTTTLF